MTAFGPPLYLTAETPFSTFVGLALASDPEPAFAAYRARGCEYVFQLYPSSEARGGVSVTCYNAKAEVVWSGSAGYDDDNEDRVIDVVRRARATSELARAEHGARSRRH